MVLSGDILCHDSSSLGDHSIVFYYIDTAKTLKEIILVSKYEQRLH